MRFGGGEKQGLGGAVAPSSSIANYAPTFLWFRTLELFNKL